jgi:enamidase
MLESIQLGNLPGVGMTVIDGIVRTGRSRNTPPAQKVPELTKAPPVSLGGGH